MSSTALATRGAGGVQRSPNPSGLADVIDLILDKGLVIDLYVRVSLVGIELLTIDARIVVASVDTYLRFAEAVNRLDLREANDSQGLPDLLDDMQEGGAKSKTKGALEGAKDSVSEFFSSDDEDSDDDEQRDDDDGGEDDERPRRRRRATASNGRRRSRRER
ncbi:MAG: gas vesicle structural protein [Thermoleophilaceae bacterium]|jgi:hypothetical protein|nr:gas vesicle structural protein [Thermoleophilaceae bacterium]